MARWSEYDTDEERLPEGMQRIGYDADTQVYSFRDADGSIWESAPGNRYGRLQRANTTSSNNSSNGNGRRSTSSGHFVNPFSEPAVVDQETSWRHDMMPLLNWFLLVGVFLLLVLWFITRGASGGSGGDEVARNCGADTTPYQIRAGDTCWAIAERKSVSLDDVLRNNEGLDCDKLAVEETICLPKA
ncbi:carbohydrate-binding module family 50 protein [Nemania sp. FL0916]|nr:carbohydrate-binding module family 50 protein [Nemania sp. FL0916]